MEAAIQEWLGLIARWIHVIAAIMWVGDSFLFMWMDSHLSKPREGNTDEALAGELWLTHSGGFYEIRKRKYLRPDQMPPHLYWFKWESYTTWISGICLLILVYFMGGGVYLVDPSVHAMPLGGAIALSLGLLVAAWVVYDALCQHLFRSNLYLAAGVGWPLIVAVGWGLGELFAPRAAFLLVGAMLGTIMTANVFFRIIPSQRAMVAATRAGTPVDTSLGVRAKQRSIHNHFLTLPVLFTMLSNHFPSMYGHPHAWLVLALLFMVGVALKITMNRRGDTPPPVVVIGGCALICVMFMTAPPNVGDLSAPYANHAPVAFPRVQEIMAARCVTCHAEKPVMPAFPAAPSGVKLDQPERIKAYAQRILSRAVITKTMPLGNLTGMTEEERLEVGAWVAQGASTDGAIDMATLGAATPAFTIDPAGDPVAQAQALFKVRCATCHGLDGTGNGQLSAALNPKPRNYRDSAWQATVTDETIRKAILDGGPAIGKSPLMPPNPDLVDAPLIVDELVKLVRSFGAGEATAAAP